MADRTVHAAMGTSELVRYDRSGKWYLEHATGRQLLTLQSAAQAALDLRRIGGVIYHGKPGGLQFDAAVRRLDGSADASLGAAPTTTNPPPGEHTGDQQ